MATSQPFGREMTNREFFIERWEQEYPATVRVFRALPADQLDYRPHPRSRSAGEVMALMIECQRTWCELCEKGQIHWEAPKGFGKRDEMIAAYERHHQAVGGRVRKLDDAAWSRKVKILEGGQVVLKDTLGRVFWLALFDAVHHRGQLSAYIRPMGGKVPSIYGPSADEVVS